MHGQYQLDYSETKLKGISYISNILFVFYSCDNVFHNPLLVSDDLDATVITKDVCPIHETPNLRSVRRYPSGFLLLL